MNKKFVVSSLILLVMLSFSASAQLVELINIDSCYASASTVSCGDSIQYYCDIDIIHNSPLVKILSNSVYFTVGEFSYNAELISGNEYSGTYMVNLSVGVDNEGDSYDFAGVEAKSSDSEMATCVFTEDIQSEECNVEFSSWEVTNDCYCEWTSNDPVCSYDNSKDIIWTANDALCDPYIYIVEETCDYCDPGWTAKYTECDNGIMKKAYFEQDPACCSLTGDDVWNNHLGGTDCTPPPDNDRKLWCNADSWSTAQKSGTGTSHSVLTGFDPDTADQMDSTYDASSEWVPLLGDFDGNYRAEVIVFGNDSQSMILMDDELLELDTYDFGAYSIFGQPALSRKNTLLVPVKSGSTYRVYTFRMESGSFVLKSNMDLGVAPANAVGSGIGCRDHFESCYMKDSYNRVYWFNVSVDDGTTNFEQSYAHPNSYDMEDNNIQVNLKNVPLIDNFNSVYSGNEIMFLMYDGEGNVNGTDSWYWQIVSWQGGPAATLSSYSVSVDGTTGGYESDVSVYGVPYHHTANGGGLELYYEAANNGGAYSTYGGQSSFATKLMQTVQNPTGLMSNTSVKFHYVRDYEWTQDDAQISGWVRGEGLGINRKGCGGSVMDDWSTEANPGYAWISDCGTEDSAHIVELPVDVAP